MRIMLVSSGTKLVLSAHLYSSHLTISWLKESHLLGAPLRVVRAKLIWTKKEDTPISWNKFETNMLT